MNNRANTCSNKLQQRSKESKSKISLWLFINCTIFLHDKDEIIKGSWLPSRFITLYWRHYACEHMKTNQGLTALFAHVNLHPWRGSGSLGQPPRSTLYSSECKSSVQKSLSFSSFLSEEGRGNFQNGGKTPELILSWILIIRAEW